MGDAAVAQQNPPLTDLKLALRLVNSLEKQARRTEDPEMKRILLASGCDIIDRVLEQERLPIAA